MWDIESVLDEKEREIKEEMQKKRNEETWLKKDQKWIPCLQHGTIYLNRRNEIVYIFFKLPLSISFEDYFFYTVSKKL